MTWRDKAAPLIAAVLAANEGKPLKEIRKALREAYPFGPYEYHPKKIWLDEAAKQLGLKKPKQRKAGEPKKVVPMPGQRELFQ